MNDDLESRVREAASNPSNMGELPDADSVGSVGSENCGDMLRMWVKFRDDGGRRVIDRATFQAFGCQTAIAVASVATEMIRGKTAEEAVQLSGDDLSAPLGPLPPMKIHCAQLVEGALKNALSGTPETPAPSLPAAATTTLSDSFSQPSSKPKITFLNP